MSGILQMLASGGAAPVLTWSGDIFHVVAGGPASGSVSINNSGSVTGSNYSGASAWFQPPTGTPGNDYYVKFATSGNAWNSGLTAGTVYALTSSRSVAWTATGVAKNGTLTVSIYRDAGGTDLVGTGTVTYSVDGTP